MHGCKGYIEHIRSQASENELNNQPASSNWLVLSLFCTRLLLEGQKQARFSLRASDPEKSDVRALMRTFWATIQLRSF